MPQRDITKIFLGWTFVTIILLSCVPKKSCMPLCSEVLHSSYVIVCLMDAILACAHDDSYARPCAACANVLAHKISDPRNWLIK